MQLSSEGNKEAAQPSASRTRADDVAALTRLRETSRLAHRLLPPAEPRGRQFSVFASLALSLSFCSSLAGDAYPVGAC